MSEEWRKAKQTLNKQRQLLEDGISSCITHLKTMEQAKATAREVDQLLSEIDAAKESDMAAVERKTEVMRVHIIMS